MWIGLTRPAARGVVAGSSGRGRGRPAPRGGCRVSDFRRLRTGGFFPGLIGRLRDVNASRCGLIGFDEAANRIYDFFWGEFCDWYLELIKPRLNFEEGADTRGARGLLARIWLIFLMRRLRLLHPVMPFITEEIWHAMYDGKPPLKSIALAAYPAADEKQIDLARKRRWRFCRI
jgi:hypothetical protein